MRATDIIAKKRDGGELSLAEISFMISGCADQSIPDYQISAWLMAIYLRSMTLQETADLTRAMIASGVSLSFDAIAENLLVDKHSTGGVGDKISLPLAPIAAAMGLHVPMVSGRALGITGGTLDKLESMPGYCTQLSQQQFQDMVVQQGYAMCGQTANLVPSDRIMYALRDVTATVESIPLITASILSKKIAEGTHSLILDVKCGSGAFMKDVTQATALAKSLVQVATLLSLKTTALVTNMEEPLGLKVGNFLEIEESIDCLQGKGPQDIQTLVLLQAAHMAYLCDIVGSVEEGRTLAQEQIDSGKALELWWKNVEKQGGNVAEVKNMLNQKRAQYSTSVKAETAGYLKISAQVIGQAGILLGVGRNQKTDPVSALAGFQFFHKSGAHVQKDETLCTLYADSQEQLDAAFALVKEQAFTLLTQVCEHPPLILQEITC